MLIRLLFATLITVFTCLAFSVKAQDYITDVQHFTEEEGLSHWNTTSAFQDSRGFIWIGSEQGLNRFDGHNFQIFTKEKNGLAFNYVMQIFEDADGWLWLIRLKNHKFFIDIKNICFINIHTLEVKTLAERFGKNAILSTKKLNKIFSNQSKTIIINTSSNELIKFRPEKGFEVIPIKSKGNFLVKKQTSDEFFVGNIETIDWEKDMYKIDTFGNVLWNHKGDHLNYITRDNTDTEWFIKRHNHHVSNPIELYTVNKSNEIIPYPNEKIPDRERLISPWGGQSYYRPSDDTFWYISEKDFWVFHPKRGLLYDFNKDYPQISANKTSNLFFDNNDNIWVTCENGLYKIQLKSSPFKKYLSIPKINYSAKKAVSTRGLLVTNEKLWVNTVEFKDYIFDLNTGETLLFDSEKDIIQKKSTYLSFAKLNDQKILRGSNLLKINNLENESIKYILPKVNNRNPSIWSIFEDSHQKHWLGFWEQGLGYWDKTQDSIAGYQVNKEFSKLETSTIYTFLDWDSQHFLIGSTSGIYLFHQKKGIIQRFWKKGEGVFQFPHNIIHHLARDKENPNVIWVATGGGGLVRWEVDGNFWENKDKPMTSNYQQFTKNDGLSHNTIYAVYEDGNYLWMPSSYGIIRFNKKDNISRIFTEKDGISHQEFNRISHHQDDKGNLYFGGLNGITSFHPSKILEDLKTTNAPLSIINFQQYDTEVKAVVNKTAEILQKNLIELPTSVKFFSIEFALLEYQDADQIQYSYKVIGQDKNWVTIDGNKLRISGLPYGDYTLKIRARDINGELSKHQLSIPILVQPPFYLKWWFIFSVVAMIFFGGFLFYKWRTQTYKKRQKELELEVRKATKLIRSQNEELKNLDKVKSNFFANVSHELRTPLTLVLAPIQSTLKNNQLTNSDYSNLLLAKSNGQRLLKMVNEILDLTKLESGKIELVPTTIVWYNFLRKIIANFESVANQKNIDFQFQYIGNQYLQVLVDPKKVETIVYNLLSNAFKFTPKNGAIHLEAKDTGQFLSIQVKDTGRGIHPDDLPKIFHRFYQSKQKDIAAEGGTGIGLALSKELTTLMEGSLSVKSELGEGSTFLLKLPRIEIISQISNEEALLVKEPIVLEEEKTTTTNVTTDENTETLLIVEDNLDLQHFLQSLLQSTYQIQTAHNGAEALKILETPTLPNLIISDVMMPIMDGYQFMEHLKNNDQYRHIPVIMLTAKAASEDKLKALRIGVDDFMTKPFNEDELLARIENLLMHSQLRNAYQQEINAAQNQETKDAPEFKLTKADAEWLAELEKTILQKLGDFNFSLETLSHEMATSRWQLNRRIKQLTGLTSKYYVQEIRLNHARNLLENREINSIKALTYEIGVRDLRHFSRQFKKRFGKNPSEYL